jgi:hypothetical protein
VTTDTDRLRAALAAAGFSQRSAAKHFGIDERTMRRYASGELPVPLMLLAALERQPDRGRVLELLNEARQCILMANPFMRGVAWKKTTAALLVQIENFESTDSDG